MDYKPKLLFLAVFVLILHAGAAQKFGSCPAHAVAKFKQLGQSKKYINDVKSKCAPSSDKCYRKCLCFVLDYDVLATMRMGVKSQICDEASRYYLFTPYVPKAAQGVMAPGSKCGKLNCGQLGPPLTGH